MNIVLTSVGRRSYLVKYFKEALGADGAVICVNSQDSGPARRYADFFYQVPESCSAAYLPELRRICRVHQIHALFSLHDLDTYVLSRSHAELSDLKLTAFLPDPIWNEIALDKLLTHHALTRHGLPCPWTTDILEEARRRMEAAETRGTSLPMIIKARYGFGSLGLRVCLRSPELAPAFQQALAEVERSSFYGAMAQHKPGQTQLIIQEQIVGREKRLGIVHDLKGRHLSTLAAEVHSMRAGETDTACTIPVEESIGRMASQLSGLTQHIGIWGIDCISREGVTYILDINPRFTGEYPFFHLAGANIPRALLCLVAGKRLQPEDLVCRTPVKSYKELVPRIHDAADEPGGAA